MQIKQLLYETGRIPGNCRPYTTGDHQFDRLPNLTPNGVADSFDVSRQAISKHIKILTECGLVTITRQGREYYCYIQPKKLDEVAGWLADFRKIWENRFNKLDDLLVTMLSKTNIKPK